MNSQYDAYKWLDSSHLKPKQNYPVSPAENAQLKQFASKVLDYLDEL